MDHVLGEISVEELKKLARENGGVVKYWLAFPNLVSPRFFNDQGQFSGNENVWYLTSGNDTIKRFTNYWHAYAHMLRLTKK